MSKSKINGTIIHLDIGTKIRVFYASGLQNDGELVGMDVHMGLVAFKFIEHFDIAEVPIPKTRIIPFTSISFIELIED